MEILVVLSLSTKFIKVATRICEFSQYLETELDMLSEIAMSVEIVIILVIFLVTSAF